MEQSNPEARAKRRNAGSLRRRDWQDVPWEKWPIMMRQRVVKKWTGQKRMPTFKECRKPPWKSRKPRP